MVNRTFCHINMAILPKSLAKMLNTTNSQLQHTKFFKVNIHQLLTTLNEKIIDTKITKLNIEACWKYWLTDYLPQHFLPLFNKNNTLEFLMFFTSLALDAPKVGSSPTSFTC